MSRPLTTLLLAAALAAPATSPAAAAISAPPAAGHNITVFPDRDFVHVDGYPPGQALTIRVVRNGTVVGTASGSADAAGVLEVNHPGGVCWDTLTPDILPGDVVQALTDAAVPAGDATTTADVAVTAGPALDAAGHVVVHGIARDATGAPLPIGQVEQRMVNAAGFTGTQHRRDARAPGDGTLTYDAPGSIHWTATYAFTAADRATALDPATMTRAMWLGANPLLLNELTISEFATPVGPTPGCNAPLAQTAITTLSRTLVNAANAGQDLTVQGIAQGGAAGVTGVSVSVPESAGSAPVAATLSPPGAAGQMTWAATISAAALADGALPQGDFHLVATYAGPGAPPAETRTLRKDTIAPAPPTATPAPGTYTTAQAVSLSSPEPGAAVRYTVDGRDPVAASPAFGAPLSITSSLGVRAVAVDAAGNVSPVAAFDYAIAPLQPVVVHDPAPAPVVVHDAPRSSGGRIAGLRIAGRVRLRVARHAGIAVSFVAGTDVTVARLRLFKAGARKPLVTKLVALVASGRQTVHLRARSVRAGRYRVEVTGGPSATALGPPVTAVVTLRR